MEKSHLDTLKRIYGGPMSERQIRLLRDVQAFVDFCIRNGLSFETVIGTLAHDTNGILAPGDMFERQIFRPKVEGYTRINAETAEEMAAIASDPTMSQDQAEQD